MRRLEKALTSTLLTLYVMHRLKACVKLPLTDYRVYKYLTPSFKAVLYLPSRLAMVRQVKIYTVMVRTSMRTGLFGRG